MRGGMRRMPNGWEVAGIVVFSGTILCACASDPSDFVRRYGYGPDPSTEDASASDPTNTGGDGGTIGPDGGLVTPPGAGIPCDIASMLATKCLACHANPPTPGALSSLVTISDMLAKSKQDGSKNVAQQSLARMQSTTSPMPPTSFNKPPTPADIAAMQAWIGNNYQGSCSDAGAPPQNLTCTSCHGDANRTAIAGADPNSKVAPPVGTKGETATTARAVGAHQAHLNKADFRTNPLACNECHVVPTSNNHSNGVVEITFGTLAKTGNVTPAFSGTALTCTGSYCHGNFSGGNTTAAPSWTGGAMNCTSCHGGPPATGDHRRSQHVGLPCSNCHGTGYSSTTVNKALHLNGVKNAGGAGSMITYNAATRSCSPQCHGTETW